jgi:amino acid adenylation domain-containing protein
VQYADYAVWQRKWLQGEVLERQLGYWRKQLGGMERLEMPTDHVRPAVESHRGGSVEFALSREVTLQMRDFSRREGVTLFMTLLAAFQVVLSRYARQREVVVGTDVANRNREETEGLIGFFVNQLVMRTEVEGERSFRWHVGEVRRTCLQAYEHQDVPFERVVEELGREKDLSRAPLFQVSLGMQNAPKEMLEVAGMEVEWFENGSAEAKNDLELGVGEREGVLRGRAVYAADLYERSTVERLLGHVKRVLESVMGDGEQKVEEIGLLSEVEQAEVLERGRGREEELGKGMAHELFEEQVRRTPEAVAVEYEGDWLSYGELNRRANQLGHYLRKLGVGPEVWVGVYMKRNLEMVVGLLGILKAGGVYVPLDPGYPVERLKFMVEETKAAVVIRGGEEEERGLGWQAIGGQDAREVLMERDWEQVGKESEENLESVVEAENLAYVVYTSGSTGRPKGAMIEQRGLVNHLQAKIADLGLNAEDRVGQNASSSFDIAIWQVLAVLLVGGRVYVVNDEVAGDAEKLLEEIEEQGVTVLETVPAMLAMMLGEQERRGEGRLGLSRLRWLFCQAEPLQRRMCRQWREMNPGAGLVNGYGATECSDDVSHCHIEEELPEGMAYAPLGNSLMNMRIYVLDERKRLVPPGVAGELYIGGVCVGRGYAGRAEQTGERFVPDPFSKKAGERMYRTGDVCRWRTDGHLEFFERMDHQVKIRGQRVELGEIEGVLSEHEGVGQAVVVVREEPGGDKRLVGYVVARAQETVTGKELQGYLKSKLPEYMVPSAIVMMEEMPLTPNGKVDRKVLPEPEYGGGREGGGEERGKARSAEEEIVSGIFAEVLKVREVGRGESFFELGGHSLLATQVVSRVRSVFGVELGLRVLFEGPTVEELAEAIAEARQGKEGGKREEEIPLERVERRGGELPLSYAQQRLWFLDQLEPGSVAYNIPFGVRLKGELKREALVRSVNEIVRRHEVLRTTFGMRDGQAYQVIAEEMELKIEEMDLRGVEEGKREEEARRIGGEEVRRVFDLGRGPLVRVKLLRMGEQEHVLLVTMHHIVSDGWSMGVMMREFSRLYGAEVEGREAELAELAVQYADYAVWQRKWLQGEVLERQLGYWRKQLADLPELELPSDHSLPSNARFAPAIQRFAVSRELTQNLKALCRQHGSTLFMALLAIFKIVLYCNTHQEDIVVGANAANRNRLETENLIGFFVNQLVLRSDLSGNPDLLEILSRVRKTVLEAYAHQDLSFDLLISELQKERSGAPSALFRAKFEFNEVPVVSIQLPHLQVCPDDSLIPPVRYDLHLLVTEEDESFRSMFLYNSNLLRPQLVRQLAAQYEAVLSCLVERPELTLQAIDEERKAQQVLDETMAKELEHKNLTMAKRKLAKTATLQGA